MRETTSIGETMAQTSYSSVPKEAVVAFAKELEQGRWAEIEVSKHQSAADHLNIPILPLLKMRLLRKLQEFSQALGSTNTLLQTADERWDASQRKLEARITLAEQDDSEELAAAGERLRNSLLLGNGLGQTNLSYPEEVAFGYKQIGLLRAEKVENSSYASPKEDAALLGLGSLVSEIEARTLALEQALPKEGEDTTRFDQIKELYTECLNLLRSVHQELDLQKSSTANGETRHYLNELKAPFIQLLNQYQ
jgi:hypothetical protein